MSARVEARRFRTWETDAHGDSEHSMRTIVKYGLIKILGAWHIRLLLVLALLFTISTLGAFSYEIAAGGRPESGTGMDGEVFGVAATLAFLPTMAFLIFVAAPLFAEDLRFNAPLFYFSKPVSGREYLWGKVGLLGVVLAATVLVPLLLFTLMALVGTILARPPTKPYQWESTAEFNFRLQDWHVYNMDTFGDWAYAVGTVVPAFLVMFLLLIVIFLAASAWTTRAWHAAIAGLASLGVLSFLGGTIMDTSRTAMGSAFGPVGWVELLIFVPLSRRFNHEPLYSWREEYYATYPAAVVTSYVFMFALIVAGWFAMQLRIRRMEGLA